MGPVSACDRVVLREGLYREGFDVVARENYKACLSETLREAAGPAEQVDGSPTRFG